MAAVGEPDIKEKLKKGYKVGNKTFKVCIDGFNMHSYFTGEVKESPRNYYVYISDDGEILNVRLNDWKLVFAEQRAKTCMVWAEPFVHLRIPKIFHLRRDPFERADENSNTYFDWLVDKVHVLYAVQGLIAQQIQDFKDFPPRQKPASFNLDLIMESVQDAAGAGSH